MFATAPGEPKQLNEVMDRHGDMPETQDERFVAASNPTKLYTRRWLVLLIFSAYVGTNSFQWIQYNIISNIISRFYDVPKTTVDWLSMVYMIGCIPLLIPATWLIDRKGLRVVAVLGSSLNALGSLVKIGSAEPHLFPVAMLGQSICSIAQTFMLAMPPKVAATWFGPREVSTACSITLSIKQTVGAVGFLLPPRIVPDVDDASVIAIHLRYMFIGTAAATTTLAILVIIFFKKQPKLPPSISQAKFLKLTEASRESYVQSMKKVISSLPSLLLIIAYSISTASYYALATHLNREILDKFPDNVVDVGQIGLTMLIAGIVGSFSCGLWLDKTGAYKKTAVAVYFVALLSMAMFTVSLNLNHLWIVYVASGFLGFTTTGFMAIGFEFASEITYPISQENSAVLLVFLTETMAMLFTLCMGYVIESASVLAANIFLCVALLIGFITTIAVKEDLKRKRSNRSENGTVENTVKSSCEVVSSGMKLILAQKARNSSFEDKQFDTLQCQVAVYL